MSTEQGGDYASVRAIEMRLFEEVGHQLKALTSAVQALTTDTRDVRERVIKIEAQNAPEKLQSIDANIRELFEKTNKIISDRTSAELERSTAMSDYKIAIEKRLTRAEVMIAPLTAIGTGIIMAIVAAIFKLL